MKCTVDYWFWYGFVYGPPFVLIVLTGKVDNDFLSIYLHLQLISQVNNQEDNNQTICLKTVASSRYDPSQDLPDTLVIWQIEKTRWTEQYVST